MTRKWIKTPQRGLRYYEHETRKNGIKKDRYYAIHFKVAGKVYDFGIGWQSGGIPEEELKLDPGMEFSDYCKKMLNKYKNNIKDRSGPQSPKEKRKIEDERRAEETAKQARTEAESLTFNEIFTKQYFPIAEQNKTKGATNAEDSLFKLWIDPVIGKLPLKNIAPIHLERIKKNMADEGRAPRSAQYAMALIRQVFNYAKDNGVYDGVCPVAKVKIPKFDNQRQRFLTHEEAEKLLTALKARSVDVYHMALLSLSSGMRAGEIFSLEYSDVNIEAGIITLRDTKNGKTRHCSMTEPVKSMFIERKPDKKDDLERKPDKKNNLVFPSTRGGLITSVSKTFELVVDELKLNEGIDDPRHKVVWHSLRHTYASWLVQGGVSLYVVQRMLGHSQISQTERYSHLHQDTITDAVKVFEAAWQKAPQETAQVINFTK